MTLWPSSNREGLCASAVGYMSNQRPYTASVRSVAPYPPQSAIKSTYPLFRLAQSRSGAGWDSYDTSAGTPTTSYTPMSSILVILPHPVCIH